tara:strand:+ start:176 stop:1339 length:1164 start_codon:yes stop_codon:yes gene_type:complete
MKKIKKKKIAYIINHASFFYSHILPIALEAKKKYDISLFHGLFGSLQMEKYAIRKIKKLKLDTKKVEILPASTNIFREFLGFLDLYNSLKNFKPDLIHCATPKGILYGGILSRLLNTKSLIIFNTGMGFLFTNKLNIFERLAKHFYISVLKNFILKHKNKKIIIENKDDFKFFIKKFNLKKRDVVLIKGSGVNINKLKKISINKNQTVLMPARVVKEKGVIEFTKASTNLKKKFPKWNFVVAGALDYRKRSKFKKNEIMFFKNSKSVSFLGYVKNIKTYYKKAAIVCLPSYREGFSKVFQEAAAMGIPIVTTNVIGCKDSILPKKTGELCKAKDFKSLQNKLEYLIINKRLRDTYGKNARKYAEKSFNLDNVIIKNIKQYNILIDNE